MADQKAKTRVFLNDVDVFSSKHIAKFLSTCLEEEDEGEEELASAIPEPVFQIVGTVSSSYKNERNSGVMEHSCPTREELLLLLLESDVILYNISENVSPQLIEEATWALTTLHNEMHSFKSRKLFILISTVMTWAMTKPLNPHAADVPLTEEDYKRRRPHPSFRALNDLEKLVMKLGRTKKNRMPAYVVASGHQYGKGENLFHYFFKYSWLVESPEVPIFGEGANYIPTIHVDDLSGVIQGIILNRPKSKYILAVDESKNTLREIVLAISPALGPGNVKEFPEQDAVSMKAFQPKQLDYLKVSLLLEPSLIKELSLKWVSEAGMVDNIGSIVEEYKVTRQLLPIRIFMIGPPAAGKTTIAKKLCDFYQIHLIQIEAVIEEKIRLLEESESETEAEQTQLKEILKSLEEDGGFSTDETIIEVIKEKLLSKPCLNQGFVLDGFPHTYKQAQLMFVDENPDTVESEFTEPSYNKKITPDNIFVLMASDEFLIERVQALPESVAGKMHYTQDTFLSRLKDYRTRGSAEDTLVDCFEELEIFPVEIDINTDDVECTATLKKIIRIVGGPKNYGPNPEELEAQRIREEEERKQRQATEAAERKQRNEATLAEMATHYQQWKKNLHELERQQQQHLSAQSLPLRTYLMKYVMPSMSEAMLECSRVRPEDPVHFLAQHLLRKCDETEED